MGALAVVVTLLAVSCGGGDKDEEDKPITAPPRVAVVNGERVVTLDEGARARAGILIETLVASSHQATVQAYGRVLDAIELVDLRGATEQAQARLDRARAALAASRAERDRVAALRAQERNASDKAFETAEAAWQGDEAEARAAEQALAVQRAATLQRWGPVVSGWIARGSGELDALLARRNMLVQVTLPAATHLAALPATVQVRGAGTDLVDAAVVSAAPRTDPQLQGASMLVVTVAGPALVPGTGVEAFVPGGESHQGVTVPVSAVVWWRGRAWAYVERAGGGLVRREVTTDAPEADGFFVASGFSAGDRVVVRGAQAVLAEEDREAIGKMEG
jgi:multidrug efflux pump subunit AcrA (membrane-fusion protein)